MATYFPSIINVFFLTQKKESQSPFELFLTQDIKNCRKIFSSSGTSIWYSFKLVITCPYASPNVRMNNLYLSLIHLYFDFPADNFWRCYWYLKLFNTINSFPLWLHILEKSSKTTHN